MSEPKPVNVKILDKDYLISCTDEEREQLHTAVTYLNMKMKEVKDSGKIVGSERIAVMTALNIAHELLAHQQEKDHYTNSVGSALRRLQDKIDEALTTGRQYEM